LEEEINKACGLDIHKIFFIATAIILSRSGEKQLQRFDRTDDDKRISNLKNWVVDLNH